VYTGEPTGPWAEAIACVGERILRVGKDRDIEPLEGPATRVIDAGGLLVLPGFIDAHVHLIWGFEVGSWIDLTDRPSLTEAVRRLADYAGSHRDEEILVGYGFDYASLLPHGLPTKEALDDAVDDRPALLMAYDGHTGWGNTRFTERVLSLAGGGGSDLGAMVRDSRTSTPTGIFLRVFDLLPLLPEIRRRQSLEGLKRTVSAASRHGITTAFDIQVELDDLHAYDDLRRAGDLPVRIVAAIHHPKGTPPGRYPEFAAARDRYQGDSFSVAAIKLYIDGVAETGSAALLEPYANDPTSRGTTEYDVEEYRAIVRRLAGLGFQVCTHATGDRGARIALDAYEALGRHGARSDLRHRIEHCEVLSPDDIPRFGSLGVVPCMMPQHAAPGLTVRWREALGPRRAAGSFPWRALLAAGASVAFASDWPVAPMDPLGGIHQAVARVTADGTPSPERISMREAIDGYTRRAAFACRVEETRGSLAEGKFGDLVVLSANLFDSSPDRVPEVRIRTTIVGGRVVSSADPGGASPGIAR
jgi:hypothetical protein